MERSAWLALGVSVAVNLGVVVPWLNRLSQQQGPVEPPPPGRVEIRLAVPPAPPRPVLPLPRRPAPAPVARPAPAPPPRLLTPPPPPPPPSSYPTAAPRRPRPHPIRTVAVPRPVAPVAPVAPSPEPVASPEPVRPPATPSPVAANTPGGDRRARRMRAPEPPVPPGKTVRVRFEIAASGQAQPQLLDGTGDARQDEAILAVLRSWTWEPALSDGRPVDAVEVFRLSGGEGAAQ